MDPQVLLQHQWSLEDTYALSVIRCYDRFPSGGSGKNISGSSLQSLFPHSCVLRLDQDFVCVWNLALISGEDYVFQEKMAVFLREHVAKAGDSNSFCGREDFSLYLNQAREALRLGDKYAPHFWHYRFERIMLISICWNTAPPLLVPLQVCSPALRILQNYDTEKDGDLLPHSAGPSSNRLQCYSKRGTFEYSPHLHDETPEPHQKIDGHPPGKTRTPVCI